MKIVITESASDDIAEGYVFQETQYRGLGDYFESAIFAELRSLAIYGGVHELHFGSDYRKIANKFPYAIYYTVESDVVEVYAIADTRKNPERLRDRFPTNQKSA